MVRNKLDKRNKTNYIMFILFSLVCVVAIIYCLIRPRGTNICLTAILLVGWFISYWQVRPNRKSPTVKPFPIWLYPVILGGIFFVLYLPFGMGFYVFEYLFSTRWPHEYEAEIKELKESGYYPVGVFPDELPESAEEVQWNVVPGMLQAHGFRTLSFVANEEDIKQCKEDVIQWCKEDFVQEWVEEYRDVAEKEFEDLLDNVITKTYDFQNNKWPVSVPEKVHFTQEELADAVQYDFSDFSVYCVGIVVVESTNRIVYYEYYP